ncbi:SDR family NAD(P)-dependent oxidoreductase [Glaciecola petra]|uniref:SDR family NAD(P)-dependent oxidoreductase n=1 Tax=Glaciecola petra TaxID=3075602 RepID=A0ABU2ZM10_9ALTE|nr:SDR family NAD(P)-dependent oxidoreductase [Aestuariibacter sp. P117]MDT0593276.1 SDR family NAD(P)-dependent oxidoreductase [Aestuariibacter sp. P117]
MSIDFQNKTALISGAAGGIGLALSRELGHLGMKIVMADIEQEVLQASANILRAEGIEVLACELDVTNFEQWESVVSAAKDKFGAIHMLINNAGVGGIPSGIDKSDNNIFQWVVDVNLMGVMYGARATTPSMKEHGEGGWIINVASMAGMNGVPYSTAYSATKAAVVSMSESWAVELKSHNIHVSALCPAFVKTRIHESLRTKQDKYKTNMLKENAENLKKGFGQAAALVESGIDASLLAKRVVEALENKQLYIFTHPNYRESMGYRARAIDKAFEDAQNSPLVKHLIDDEIVSL